MFKVFSALLVAGAAFAIGALHEWPAQPGTAVLSSRRYKAKCDARATNAAIPTANIKALASSLSQHFLAKATDALHNMRRRLPTSVGEVCTSFGSDGSALGS